MPSQSFRESLIAFSLSGAAQQDVQPTELARRAISITNAVMDQMSSSRDTPFAEAYSLHPALVEGRIQEAIRALENVNLRAYLTEGVNPTATDIEAFVVRMDVDLESVANGLRQLMEGIL